jgi:hypothetical protein
MFMRLGPWAVAQAELSFPATERFCRDEPEETSMIAR